MLPQANGKSKPNGKQQPTGKLQPTGKPQPTEKLQPTGKLTNVAAGQQEADSYDKGGGGQAGRCGIVCGRGGWVVPAAAGWAAWPARRHQQPRKENMLFRFASGATGAHAWPLAAAPDRERGCACTCGVGAPPTPGRGADANENSVDGVRLPPSPPAWPLPAMSDPTDGSAASPACDMPPAFNGRLGGGGCFAFAGCAFAPPPPNRLLKKLPFSAPLASASVVESTTGARAAPFFIHWCTWPASSAP
mmetsp:Transcript_30043/g.89094  ORF Transcript_30043/g.89094 Transcript_30043/m.89094 type:complete len:247 (-) Transcript_30043:2602-3342(-)